MQYAKRQRKVKFPIGKIEPCNVSHIEVGPIAKAFASMSDVVGIYVHTCIPNIIETLEKLARPAAEVQDASIWPRAYMLPNEGHPGGPTPHEPRPQLVHAGAGEDSTNASCLLIHRLMQFG
jgi:hypothetical protein